MTETRRAVDANPRRLAEERDACASRALPTPIHRIADWLSNKGAALAGARPSTSNDGDLMLQEHSETKALSQGSGHGNTPFAKRLRWLIQSGEQVAEKWTITPAMAADMLAWNDRNRPVTPGIVEKYVSLMKAGRWFFTGEPIIFSKNRLLDGQHRLLACEQAGAAIECLVVVGAPDDAFAFIDVGKTRTASDIFAIHGVPNSQMMAAATVWVVGYDSNSVRSAEGSLRQRLGLLDHEQLYGEYLKHPGLQESAHFGRLFAINKLAPPSLITALHYVCARKHRKEADAFFEQIADGLGFEGKKDPAYQLHKRLVDNAISQEKLTRSQIAAFFVKAWNARRLNRPVGVLRFNPDEPFPKAI